jgi:DNA-binding IclR family transcriptional regulator
VSEQREEAGLPSPPTDRVVAVVELLLAAESPLRVSDIVESLDISRSTCFAILETLERRNWVERRANRTYEPGRGLIPVANAVRARLPILQRAEDVMRGVLDDLEVEGLTLSLVGGGRLAQVARMGPRPGLDVGPLFQIPMYPPFGAAVVAYGRPEDQARWLAEVPDAESREHLRRVLDTLRTHGVAVWRLDAATELLSEAIFASQAVIDRLAATRRDVPEGRVSLLSLFDRLGMSVDDLTRSEPVSVAYLEAPIFDLDGNTCYVLEVHVLRDELPRPELGAIVARARAAADELTLECGGVLRAFQPLPSPAASRRQPSRTGTRR